MIMVQTASGNSLGSKQTCGSTGNANRALWGRRSCFEPVCLVRQTSPYSSDTDKIHITLSLILNPGKSVEKSPVRFS